MNYRVMKRCRKLQCIPSGRSDSDKLAYFRTLNRLQGEAMETAESSEVARGGGQRTCGQWNYCRRNSFNSSAAWYQGNQRSVCCHDGRCTADKSVQAHRTYLMHTRDLDDYNVPSSVHWWEQMCSSDGGVDNREGSASAGNVCISISCSTSHWA